MTTEGSRRLTAVWFADIVGYTDLSANDPDAALRVVRELQRIARMQCDARGGRIVKLRDESVLAVFDSADGAVRGALGLRDAFLNSPEVQSPEVRSPAVSIRIGLHLGDVAEGGDGDISGDAVSATSRIQEIAEPGQVLLSDIAYQLLRQRSTL
jgi:class 3 adenylate cyclase